MWIFFRFQIFEKKIENPVRFLSLYFTFKIFLHEIRKNFADYIKNSGLFWIFLCSRIWLGLWNFEIFFEIFLICQKFKILSKVRILAKSSKSCQKFEFLPKVQNLVKSSNSCAKTKIDHKILKEMKENY